MLDGTMKPAPASTSKPISCKPAEFHQTLPETATTDLGAKRARTQTPPNASSPQPTFEALMALYHRTSNLLARGGVIHLEIDYLERCLAHSQALEADPNYAAAKPPERKLSQYDEDEFQFLAHSGVKMLHPAMVHPARTELATGIYQEFYKVYRQSDLDALWDFLSSSHAQLQAIPAPPPGEGEERASMCGDD